MAFHAKSLAAVFNRAAPPPAPPRDDTVYEDRGFRLFERAGAEPAPLLPGWQDMLLPEQQWEDAFHKSPLGRQIIENLEALQNADPGLPYPVTASMRRAQMDVLRRAEAENKTHGYRITDPFRPLEDLESPSTKDWIEAQNERTRLFTADSPARAQCESFLREAWQERAFTPFTPKYDASLCAGDLGRSDPWQYPSPAGHGSGFIGAHDGRDYYYWPGMQDGKICSVSSSREGITENIIMKGEPGNRIRGAFIHQDRLFVSFYHNCADALRIFNMEGRHLADVNLPAGKLYRATIEPSGNLRLRMATFTRPECDYIYDIKAGTVTPEDDEPGFLDDCIVEQLWVHSSGAQNVPMWVLRRKDTVLDGSAAAKIWAYGAAGIPVNPGYGANIAQWVRAGGIYVLANIHGGNEFGEEWRKQGEGMNRSRVIDDLASCARKLCLKNYTSPERIVIEGGSNGGWLVLQSVVQRSFPYGAAVSHVPVADLLNMKWGTSPYPGFNAKERHEYAERLRLSPLHNVTKGYAYTPTMITAGDGDEVAHPWHAYKMAAALQAAGDENLCLLRVRRGSGHRTECMTTDELAGEISDIHAFIEKMIGPVDQETYKAAPRLVP